MPLPAMSLAVVGVNFPNKRGPARRFELAMCQPGEPVELRLEPANPADPLAVAVFSCRGIQLGYLSAERAPRIGAIMREGRPVACIFQEQSAWGAVIRAAFDGECPVLPEIHRADAPDEHDFWPDYIPPDD